MTRTLSAPELDSMGAAAPHVRAALSRLWAAAHDAVDPLLLGVVRPRVESMLGMAVEDVRRPEDAFRAAALDLVDQFVFYVPGVSDELRAPLLQELGEEGLRTFLEAVYAIDQATRLRVAYARLFEPGDFPPPAPLERGTVPPLREAMGDYHASAMALAELDDLTSEIVRLRAASYHDCKT